MYMPYPSTPLEHVALIRKKSELLPPVGERWGNRIFEEIMQGDEFIDEVQELMCQLDLLSLDDPDLDIIFEGTLIDAIWYRIVAQIQQRIQDTMTQVKEAGQG